MFHLPLIYSLHQNCTRKQCIQETQTIIEQIPYFERSYKDIVEYTKKHGINRIIRWDGDYHYRFQYMKSNPQIMFRCWNYNILHKPIVWVVWPRIASDYGKYIVTKLLENNQNNVVTISWLADGIDTHCCLESLRLGVPTIAVLGWGIWHFIKTKHSLIDQIIWNWWLILSEYKINMRPTKYSFPQRNRIIAWLSDSIFIPQAWKQSWSLITVDFALDYGKPVFGIPNSIFCESSFGSNQYISEWKIQPLYCINQFWSRFWKIIGFNYSNTSYNDYTNNGSNNNGSNDSDISRKTEIISNLNKEEKIIYELIIQKPHTIEYIIEKTINLLKSSNQILSCIILLESKWLIYEHNGLYEPC